MRPKLITPRKIILALLAFTIFTSLTVWLIRGGRMDFLNPVPSTKGKIAYASDQNGSSSIYMTDASGSGAAVNLTGNGQHTDAEPAWSVSGKQVAFTADRNGATRQVYWMDAKPGSQIRQLTNTSTTKELPTFGGPDMMFFLDAGKISRIDINNNDMDIIFPSLEGLKEHFGSLFETGGLRSLVSSDDGKVLASVLRQEHGEALLVYFPGTQQLACLGIAQSLKVTMLPDGRIAALFLGCDLESTPLRTPQVLFDPAHMDDAMKAVYKVPRLMGSVKLTAEMGDNPNAGLLLEPPKEGGSNLLVVFDNDLKPAMGAPIPPDLKPNGLAVSPDGKVAVVTANTGSQTGIFALRLDGSQSGGILSPLPATEPSFSPDGTQVAFVSKDDVYIASIASPGEPTNLTKGKGKNHTPVWSPAKSEGK